LKLLFGEDAFGAVARIAADDEIADREAAASVDGCGVVRRVVLDG
jgi:hypothetical protein